MANDCITKYYFDGPKKDIITFAKKLVEWTSTENEALYPRDTTEKFPPLEKHFMNILYNANPTTIYPDLDPRGEVTYSNAKDLLKDKGNDHPVLYLETVTAWSVANDVWYSILDSYFPNITFYYYEKEPGFSRYNTNDLQKKFFDIDYCIYDRNYSIFRKQEDEFFYNYSDWSAKDLTAKLRDFFQKPTASLKDLIAEARQKYKIDFEKINYISPELEKAHLLRRGTPSQKLKKKFLIQIDKPYPYIIKFKAKSNSWDIHYSLKILYDKVTVVDNIHITSNLFSTKAFRIRGLAKKIAYSLQQQFYKLASDSIYSFHDFNSTSIIHNVFVSIKIKDTINIIIKAPLISNDRFSFYEQFKISFEQPISGYCDLKGKDYDFNEKNIYHLVVLIIYALLDIPNDRLKNITIKEQDFLK